MVVREVKTKVKSFDRLDNGRASETTGAHINNMTSHSATIENDAIFHFQRVRLITTSGKAIYPSAVSTVEETAGTIGSTLCYTRSPVGNGKTNKSKISPFVEFCLTLNIS